MKNIKEFKLGLIGIGAFLFYFISSVFKGDLAKLIFNENTSNNIINIYSIVFSIILTLIIMLFFKQGLKHDYLIFKENHKEYFDKYLKYWYIALALMAISNIIIMQFLQDTLPANEENVRLLFNSNPIIIFISAVLIAPVLEELVFRLSFRYMFKTRWLFVLFAGLTFGAFHVFLSSETLIELIYIIPYSIPGFAFALALDKSDNIFVPMGLHFIHNGILMSLQFIVLIFGNGIL